MTTAIFCKCNVPFKFYNPPGFSYICNANSPVSLVWHLNRPQECKSWSRHVIEVEGDLLSNRTVIQWHSPRSCGFRRKQKTAESNQDCSGSSVNIPKPNWRNKIISRLSRSHRCSWPGQSMSIWAWPGGNSHRVPGIQGWPVNLWRKRLQSMCPRHAACGLQAHWRAKLEQVHAGLWRQQPKD